MLNSEIGIYNLYDLLQYFPFRYEDRSVVEKLSNVTESSIEGVYMVQVLNKKVTRKFKAKNLKVKVKDNTGYAELVWLKVLIGLKIKLLLVKNI